MIEWRREVVELPDGDFLEADWMVDQGLAAEAPILVMLHGLEGSSDATYARMAAKQAQARGWRAVVLHFRDCGGTPNRLPRRYHAGDTADPHYFISGLRERYPMAPLLAAGYSLGGNVLLKYVGEQASASMLAAVAAVSVPFDLQNAADALNSGASRFYRWYLLRKMKAAMRRKFTRADAPFDWSAASRARDFAEFDDLVTAPLHGFRDKDDYYGRSSCGRYLHRIETPTLILNARDDPFMTPQALPATERLPPAVHMEITEQGGHIGFVCGDLPWRPSYWLPHRLMRFFDRQLALQHEQEKGRRSFQADAGLSASTGR